MPELRIRGRRLTISFIFTEDALSRVQLWFYEGPNQADARKATDALITHLSRRGPIRTNDSSMRTATTAAIFARLAGTRDGRRQPTRVQLFTAAREPGLSVHGSITRLQIEFFVLLFLTSVS